MDRRAEEQCAIIAFRAPPELVAAVDSAAALEGVSRSDIARRAVMRDLRRAREESAHEQ